MVLPSATTTDRLHLRAWRAADAATLEDLVSENLTHLAPWMGWVADEPRGVPARIELVTRWDDERRRGGDAVYGVFLHDGTAIGGCGLHTRLGAGALEIGYWIGRRHLRQGYAREVARGLTDLAFEEPGIERVEIHHDIGNLPSEGVPRSLGYDDGGVVTSDREVAAPGECGTDRVWFVTRARWTAG